MKNAPAEPRADIAELAELRRLRELDALLPTLAGVLDLREVFGKISDIARRVISHDVMLIALIGEDGQSVRIWALAGGLPPDAIMDGITLEEAGVRPDPWEYTITADIPTETELPLAPRIRKVAEDGGFHALLRIAIRVEGSVVGVLNFASRQRALYTAADLLVARVVRDHLALALSHQRMAERRERLAAERELKARAEARVSTLTEQLTAAGGYTRVVGASKLWRAVVAQAAQVASTQTTVLVTGESGTGKEVVARLIHRGSRRASGPFIAINCAALPESLLESELFGFEKGAFSGAVQAKPGRIEQASGGTLFLDEIGEMELVIQAKLLRFLEQREFQRLGGTKVLKADVRIVAATNQDLRAASKSGGFREDLYYRISVFEIRTPPLRDRPDDFLPLAENFLAEVGRSLGRPPAVLSRDARERLLGYHWPGNVRELRNVLERASIVCPGGLITSEHLAIPAAAPISKARAPDGIAAAAEAARPKGDADLGAFERATILRVIEEARFNKSLAAKRLGITRGQLYFRLKKYGLDVGAQEE